MKLILTDLDNTLLRSDKSISPYTVEILKKCQEKGVLIAYATARAESAMARFITAVQPDILISNGGATVRVGQEIIYQNLISAADVARILSMCRKLAGESAGITVEAVDGYYCNFIPEDPDRRAASTYTDYDGFEKASYKITAELEQEAWAEQIVEACPNCTYINFTGEIWRRIAARNSNKETALRILLEHLNMDVSEVVACGDDYNDLEMLKMAGTAVAVSNAIDEVKDISAYVVGSNDEDGVAHWLEENYELV